MVGTLAPNLEESDQLDPALRLNRELLKAAELLTAEQARFFVDRYYQQQRHRIAWMAQGRTLDEQGEPNDLAAWLADQEQRAEKDIALALGRYARAQPLGRWALSVTGIGPVISAGLLAHIDISLCPTAGHIWRFAGLDPTVSWDRGVKRPWNAKLKRLCWIAGESFVKVQNNPSDTYGQVYVARKAMEQERNEAGLFADQAAVALAAKRYGADTVAREWYEQGKLPPARIHLRAERYAVKLFISGYHTVGHWLLHGTLPPLPYAIEHLGHAHYFGPPNTSMFPDLHDALLRAGLIRE